MRVSETRCFAPVIAVAALAFAEAGCGGEPKGAPAEGRHGGTLIALWAADVDNIDPGITNTQLGTQIVHATQKTLYRPEVDDASATEPDLAVTDPQISTDGCHITVALKRGVRFSPPVGREVTSADVKYAIERGFFNSVNNLYAGVYFGSLRGAQVGAEPGTRIPGITTPDDHTVVFELDRRPGASRCPGSVLAGALAMPLSAPVPPEIRAAVRRRDGVDLRRPPGRNRPVHGREQRLGKGGRLRARPADPARPQPELERAARQPPGLRRRDRDPRRATTTPR